MAACSRCVANCNIIHQLQEKKGSSAVTWFFKFMFGVKYYEHMFLPPKFAATVSNPVSQKIDLEDSQGVRWPVTVCKVDGSLAFTHGWSAFFWDHGLTQGDLVIFIYLRTHFIVKIFDKSGCEKQDFAKSNTSKKRTRSDREDAARELPSKSKSRSSMKNKSSNPSFSCRLNDPVEIFAAKENPPTQDKRRRQGKAKDCVEEWCFLSDLVTRDQQNEDQRQLFDLFDLEKCSNNLRVNSSENSTAANVALSRTSEVGLGGDKPENEILVANQPVDGTCKPKDIATEDIEQMEARKGLGRLSSLSDLATHNGQNSGDRSPDPTARVAVKKEKSRALNAGIGEHGGANAHNRQNSDHAPPKPTPKVTVKKEKSCILNVGVEEHGGANEIGVRNRQNSDRPSPQPTAQVAVKKEKSRLLSAEVEEHELANGIGAHDRNSDRPSPEPTARVVVKKEKSRTLNAGVEEYEDANEIGGYATLSGKEPKLVKFEPVEILPHLRSHKKKEVPPPEMEPEAGALAIIAISSELDDSVEVVGVARDPSCFVLPSRLAARRLKNGRKVVLLQDPQLRLWPVYYLDRPNSKVLTSGWKAFYMANEIQPGDECIFMLEDKVESAYVVAIIRKPTLLLEYKSNDQEKSD